MMRRAAHSCWARRSAQVPSLAATLVPDALAQTHEPPHHSPVSLRALSCFD
jgi:hypothetical protein